MNKKQIEILNMILILFVLFIFAIFFYWLSTINNSTEMFVPAIIILVSNVFSHEYGSRRYDTITAIFGWIAVIFMCIWGVLLIINNVLFALHSATLILKNIQKISYQIFSLSVITALSRDYEKILKPKAQFFENKFIEFYNFIRKKFKI